jgi:hypothetical protein
MEELINKYQNLCQWITNHGGYVNPKLTVEQTEKFGRTIITQVDIEPGEDLFRLPKELQLNPNTCGLERYNLSGTFEYRDQVVISLLYECQNPQTKWRPYVLLLPQLSEFSNHPMVLFYQNKFPSISTEIFNRVSNLYQSFNQFWLKLQDFNSTTNLFSQMPNFNECMWAFLTVITRMWAGSGLVPFADMLQHSNYSPIYLDSQGENFSSMTSKEKITSGSTIYDNYLVQDDITLYVNFGFVEQSDRTHLSIGFQFETINTVIASIINSQRHKFENKKIYISSEGINQEMMAFLRLHLLDANDLKIGQFENDQFFYQIISLANELRCLQKLKFRISHLLDKAELDYVQVNFSKLDEGTTEWQICKLIQNIATLKDQYNNFIENYWKSFLS